MLSCTHSLGSLCKISHLLGTQPCILIHHLVNSQVMSGCSAPDFFATVCYNLPTWSYVDPSVILELAVQLLSIRTLAGLQHNYTQNFTYYAFEQCSKIKLIMFNIMLLISRLCSGIGCFIALF